jgi:molecular chaperone Hsp33
MHSSSGDDSSQRFIFDNLDIRGEIVSLDKTFLDCIAGKKYPDAVAKLVGEFLAASALLSTTIKFEGRLVLQVRSKGEIAVIMGECTHEGKLRGIARYIDAPASEEFEELLKDGTLVITIDTKKGEPYQGIVSLEGGSMAECLKAYFEQSEQLHSEFIFASNAKRISAMMLQQLPAQLEKDSEKRSDHWEHFATLTRTLTADELLDLPNAEILRRLFHQEELRVFEAKSLEYSCSCSRERTAKALLSLGKEEIDSLIEERGGVEMSCEFCGTEYNFGPGELALLSEKDEDTTSH